MLIKFEDFIGDVPGVSASFFTLSTFLAKTAGTLDSTASALRKCPSKAPSWDGKAHAAFVENLNSKVKEGFFVADGTKNGADALKNYAYMHNFAKNSINSAKAEMKSLDEAVENSSDECKKWSELLPKAQQIAEKASLIIDELQKAADTCAAELRAALHLEAIEIRNSKNIGELKSLEDKDILRINYELEHMNFRNISQGAIGDCYLIANIMAIMKTKNGRKYIQDSIKPHYNSDGEQDGYLVTIYDDFNNIDPRKKRTVLVTSIYQNGSGNEYENDNKVPGVVSILESAYGQMYEGGTRGDSFFGPTGITGGLLGPTMEEMTNKDAKNITLDPKAPGSGYSVEKREDIQKALKNHQPVTASTVGSDFMFNNSISKEVVIDGRKEEIKISRNHAFVVVAADDTGVTLRNPWGSNIGSDNVSYPKFAEFKISWSDFGSIYPVVSIGGGYP